MYHRSGVHVDYRILLNFFRRSTKPLHLHNTLLLGYTCIWYLYISKVKPALNDLCQERPPVFEDHLCWNLSYALWGTIAGYIYPLFWRTAYFWQDVYVLLQLYNWPCHERPPVLLDQVFMHKKLSLIVIKLSLNTDITCTVVREVVFHNNNNLSWC